ncbi:MAG: hypothetical protein JW772_00655 [Candidatus Diapherotrites archaeon]|nr:hypothetical protein [Candidatus Diapherotrites archaeon]
MVLMFLLENGLLGEPTNGAVGAAETALGIVGNPTILLAAILLIGFTLIIIFLIKRIIVNSILGIIAWAIVYFIFNIELPLIPSIIVSVIFGLAGIGAMLLLKFFGLF